MNHAIMIWSAENSDAHVCQTDVGMLKNKTLSAEISFSLTEDVL